MIDSASRVDRPQLFVTMACIAASGLAGGFLWIMASDPVQWEFNGAGWTVDELAISARFGVTVWFIGIGLVVGLVAGSVIDRRHSELGWRAVPAVIITTCAAAFVTWQIGALFGPADHLLLADPASGDVAPEALSVDYLSAFVVWPLFGVLAVTVSSYLRLRGTADPHIPADERDSVVGEQ